MMTKPKIDVPPREPQGHRVYVKWDLMGSGIGRRQYICERCEKKKFCDVMELFAPKDCPYLLELLVDEG